MNKAYAILTLMLLATPGVLANHPEAGNYTFATTEYQLATNGTDNQNVAVTTLLLSMTFTDAPRNDFNVTSHILTFEVKGTGMYRADSNGQWRIVTTLDDVVMPDCSYVIQTFNSGVLGGDLPVVPHHAPSCKTTIAGDGVNGGTHTLNVTATVDVGSPAELENYNTHVSVTRQDIYMIPQDQNELTETISLYWPIAMLIFLMFQFRKMETNAERVMIMLMSMITVGTAVVLVPDASMRLFVLFLGAIPVVQAIALYRDWQDHVENDDE